MLYPTIFLDDLIQEVRRLAGTWPDAVYYQPEDVGGGCRYDKGQVVIRTTDVEFTLDQEGCIYGQIMPFIGAVEASIPVIFGIDPNDEESEAQRAVLSHAGSVVTARDYRYTGSTVGQDPLNIKLNWMRTVQSEQDQGNTWGNAVKVADELFPIA